MAKDIGRVASDRATHEPSPTVSALAGEYPSRMAFNVNESVFVKLTERGLDILQDAHKRMRSMMPSVGEFVPPAVDAGGRSRFQMWELMHTFGEYCWNGCQVPFETTILLDATKLQGAIPRDSDGSGEADETRSGSAEGDSADPKGIAQGDPA